VNGETQHPQQPFYFHSKTGKKEYHGMDYDLVLKEVGAEVCHAMLSVEMR
jgi:hypothetical protein